MCGRYTITIHPDAALADLGVAQMPEGYQPRYNVAPTQPVVVVADAVERGAEWMRWGLIPFWAKDTAIGSRLINARAETIREKPAFQQAFAKRRCLVLADGFYEWKKGAGPGGKSQPYYFRRADAKPFAFAGLWEFWQPAKGVVGGGEEGVRSCTIITCAANDVVRPIHERMPVMLNEAQMWAWLADDAPETLQGLLQPYPARLLAAYPVGSLVNSPALDTAQLIAPLQ